MVVTAATLCTSLQIFSTVCCESEKYNWLNKEELMEP